MAETQLFQKVMFALGINCYDVALSAYDVLPSARDFRNVYIFCTNISLSVLAAQWSLNSPVHI